MREDEVCHPDSMDSHTKLSKAHEFLLWCLLYMRLLKHNAN